MNIVPKYFFVFLFVYFTNASVWLEKLEKKKKGSDALCITIDPALHLLAVSLGKSVSLD